MKKIGSYLLCGICVLLCGCNQPEVFLSYPVVTIPGYETSDYAGLLSDANPEIVYNAVCNLIPESGDMAQALSEPDTADAGVRATAALVYEKMKGLLASKDERVLSSALRFFREFGPRYAMRRELIAPVLSAHPGSANGRYEQVALLSALATAEVRLPAQFVRAKLMDRSWLVSRSTYSLINTLENAPMRALLMRRYARMSGEMEKLLILKGFASNFSDEVFSFLSRELLSTRSPALRRQILTMLPQGKDPEVIAGWLETHRDSLSVQDKEALASACYGTMGAELSSRILALLIRQGFTPEEQFLANLYSAISTLRDKKERTQEEEAALGNLVRVKEAIVADKALSEAWLALEAHAAKTKTVDPRMQQEYDACVDDFMASIDAILKKYGAAETERRTYLNEVAGLKEYLREKFGE